MLLVFANVAAPLGSMCNGWARNLLKQTGSRGLLFCNIARCRDRARFLQTTWALGFKQRGRHTLLTSAPSQRVFGHSFPSSFHTMLTTLTTWQTFPGCHGDPPHETRQLWKNRVCSAGSGSRATGTKQRPLSTLPAARGQPCLSAFAI